MAPTRRNCKYWHKSIKRQQQCDRWGLDLTICILQPENEIITA
jgi:hypothetical protein